MCHAHSDYKRPSLHTAAHYEFSSCSVLYISTSKYSLSRMETNKSRMAVWGIRNGQICLRMHTFPCGTWRLPGAAPGSTAVCKQPHGCCTLINDRGRLSPFPKEGMQRSLKKRRNTSEVGGIQKTRAWRDSCSINQQLSRWKLQGSSHTL